MQGKIFISYNRSNSDFVDRLSTDLAAHQHDVWVDRHDIRGGDSWGQALQAEINDCDLVIVVLSPEALGSQWVRKEILFASSVHKPMIPIVCKDFDARDLFVEIADLQRIDFTHSYEAGLAELLNSIQYVLKAPLVKGSPLIPIEPALLALLNSRKDSCRQQNTPFQTPSLLLALIEIPQGVGECALDAIRQGLSADVTQRLQAYIASMAGAKDAHFTDFAWEERADVQQAWRLALRDSASHVTEQYLLLGILETPSNTQRSLKEFLGEQSFSTLQSIIRKPSEVLPGTPGIEPFF